MRHKGGYPIPVPAEKEPWEVATRRKRRRKPRKPSLTSVAKEAEKAHIPVARYEVLADRIIVITGKNEIAPETTGNPWDEVLDRGRAH